MTPGYASFLSCRAGNKKSELFDYYAQYFSTVEINGTFYRPPGEVQVNSWIKKGKNKKSFEYSVKMPLLVTHNSGRGRQRESYILGHLF
jgi:uncharacterized protein YecE (DUF72 family)